MALPLLQITKLLAQLTMLTPVATEGVDRIRKLVETVRRGDATTSAQLDALRQAVELQNSVNREVAEQLRIVEAVLDNVQRSLKIWAAACAGTAVVAVAALLLAIFR